MVAFRGWNLLPSHSLFLSVLFFAVVLDEKNSEAFAKGKQTHSKASFGSLRTIIAIKRTKDSVSRAEKSETIDEYIPTVDRFLQLHATFNEKQSFIIIFFLLHVLFH